MRTKLRECKMKMIGKTPVVTKNISMTQTQKAWVERQAEERGVSASRVIQDLIDEKIHSSSK